MKDSAFYIIVAFFFVACDILVGTEKDEPCPPSIGSSCNAVNFIAIDTDAAWSPDGNTIVFFSPGNDGEDFGIYLINADGSDRRLFHSGLAEAPAWSPNGQWIAFHQNAHIFKKHVESDSLVQLTLEGRNFHPDWSSDGKLITYNKSICNGPRTCGIWLMNNDGLNHIHIDSYGNHPNWHPFESEILYSKRTVTNEGTVLGDSLWIYSLVDNNKSLLTSLNQINYDNRHFSFSPSGSKIVFQSQPGPDSSVPPPWLPQVWIMNSDGSGLKQLTDTGGLNSAWSPDGQWIIYTETYETGRLWLMRPDGSDKHQLTFD